MATPIASSIVDLIGNTPLLELGRYTRGAKARVVAKLEMFNPISIKDRPVWGMISGAEKRGEIKPGDMLVEATSGNTGMALAYIGGMRGYRVSLFMSEAQSIERRRVLAALGATIVLTPAAEGTKGARERAVALAKSTEGAFYVGQHHNRDNRQAHCDTTGPELWRDTEGKLDVLVAGLGTCGTICGVAEYIKPKKASFKTVGVEPARAAMISTGQWSQHGIMGLSPGFVPDNLDRSLVDEIVTVSEEQAYEACRQLAQQEGILVGISSGANAHVAKILSEREEYAGKLMACIFPDTGERYFSVEGLFSR
jgi:cysteine synthase A